MLNFIILIFLTIFTILANLIAIKSNNRIGFILFLFNLFALGLATCIIYFLYFSDYIQGSTLICLFITAFLLTIFAIVFTLVHGAHKNILGHILLAIILLGLIIWETPISKYDRLAYSLTFYKETEELGTETNIYMIAVQQALVNKKYNENILSGIGLEQEKMLYERKLLNQERYMYYANGIFSTLFEKDHLAESIKIVNDYLDFESEGIKYLKSKENLRGNSAGLALVLSGLIEKGDLVNNVQIAITGAIDGSGNVKAIGSVKEKVHISFQDGFEYMFVPRANYEEAINVANALDFPINIIPISTINEGIQKVQELNNI